MQPNLNKVLKKIESIPTLPLVVTKIMHLVENPKTTAKEITSVIQYDPALTLKILKVVNSAYYGFPKSISTITHAIMILGFEEVRNLAMSVAVFDLFKKNSANELLFDRAAFWKHSIGVGVCSRILAKRVRYKEPEEAFVTGLLHDIGKIILDQFFPEDFEIIINLIKRENLFFMNAERRVLNFDHTAIGLNVCTRWGLPQLIIEGITNHHSPLTVPIGKNPLPHLVHAADVFTRIQKIGSGGDPHIPQLLKEVWEYLKLQPSDLHKIYEEINEELSKAVTFLELAGAN